MRSGYFIALVSLVGGLAFPQGARPAAIIDRRIRIQPIQVCSEDGTVCANPNQTLFAAETAKIWAQAGLRGEFLPVQQFAGSNWLDLQTGIFSPYSIFTLAGTAGHGQHPDPTVINLWFVRSIGNGAYGHSLQTDPQGVEHNGIAVADNTFSYNGGTGRLDVIAHELGHNLGLDHDTLGAAGPANLMSSSRSVPATIADIYPDGSQLDYLNELQVNQARSTSFVVLGPPVSIRQATNAVVLSWQAPGATLESAPSMAGPWAPVANQTNPYVLLPTAPAEFFRLRQ